MRTLLLLLTPLAALTLWGADTNQPIVVSAASPQAGITPDSLATIYGDQLATQTAAATLPWPTSLGDMPGVSLVDSAGKTWQLQLIYVSPTQMNVYLPAGIALGPGTVQFPFTGLPIGVGTAALRIVPVSVQRVATGIFTADGSGMGVVAATALQVTLPDLISYIPVFLCKAQDLAAASCFPTPINLGIDTPIYLSLYGTGVRGWTTVGTPLNTTVTIGTQSIPALYAGPQNSVPGLDQVNVALPLTLRGAGLVNVSVTAAGVTSNVGQIYIN